MRPTIILLVLVGIFAASQANEQELVDKLKGIGLGLANDVVDKASHAINDVAQAGLDELKKLLNNPFGKRHAGSFLDHAKGALAKLKGFATHLKTHAGAAFSKALDKLKAIYGKFQAKLGSLKDAKPMQDEVDDVVAEHHVEQKRILSDLFQKAKDLVAGAVAAGKNIVSNALTGLKAKASEVVSDLLQKGTDLLVGKRATLSDHLQTIGGAISSAVAPLKDTVAQLGNTLKGHFSNLVDKVKGHVTALKGKLAGHVEDLKTHGKVLLDHGKNALGALAEVVTDIAKQTLNNAAPAIDQLAKTAANAGNVVLDHLAGKN